MSHASYETKGQEIESLRDAFGGALVHSRGICVQIIFRINNKLLDRRMKHI